MRRTSIIGIAVAIAAVVPLGVLDLGGDRAAAPAGESPVQSVDKTDPMPWVTRRGHDLIAGGERFHAWGFNYGIADRYAILDYFDKPTARLREHVFGDMREASDLGINTLRIYLEVGSFMRGPNTPRRAALRAYSDLLVRAERLHLYLDVTGNVNWRKAPAWYDALGEQARWDVQARFWRAVAGVGRASPAVLLYELTSEPSITNSDSWYAGELGGYMFVQNIVRDIGGRDPKALAFRWTKRMGHAIRGQDRRHLIGIGFLPYSGGAFAHAELTRLLDVLLVHQYPGEGKASEALEVVYNFSDHRLPVVIGETAPPYTRKPTEVWSQFLIGARPYVDGYLFFYDGRRPSELTAPSKFSEYLRWALRQFLDLRGRLVGAREGNYSGVERGPPRSHRWTG